MSAYPLSNLGVMSVKEMDTVLVNASDKVSTTEVRSTSTMNVTGSNNVTIRSNSGDVILNAPQGDVVVKGDMTLDGSIGDSTGDTLRFVTKTVTLNKVPSPSDSNASGSGIYVCGTDYASFIDSQGTSGSKDSISVLWKNDSGGIWCVSGGNLSFSKTIASGDKCKFTFFIQESGDLVLQRTIGNQVTQSLSYWQNLG